MVGGMEFWFRRQFNLPPTDPRFLDATLDDIETEFWAHYYKENSPDKEVEDDEFDVEAEIAAMNDDDWEEVDLSGRTAD
jgi:hypothetical protein